MSSSGAPAPGQVPDVHSDGVMLNVFHDLQWALSSITFACFPQLLC